jgi:hypothetical protein
VAITTPVLVLLGGAITADGGVPAILSAFGAGSGGTVAIHGANITGSASAWISARGGAAGISAEPLTDNGGSQGGVQINQYFAAGGGGRIAIRYTGFYGDFAHVTGSRISAAGGALMPPSDLTSVDQCVNGGAGTVFLSQYDAGTGQDYNVLSVANINNARPAAAATPLNVSGVEIGVDAVVFSDNAVVAADTLNVRALYTSRSLYLWRTARAGAGQAAAEWYDATLAELSLPLSLRRGMRRARAPNGTGDEPAAVSLSSLPRRINMDDFTPQPSLALDPTVLGVRMITKAYMVPLVPLLPVIFDGVSSARLVRDAAADLIAQAQLASIAGPVLRGPLPRPPLYPSLKINTPILMMQVAHISVGSAALLVNTIEAQLHIYDSVIPVIDLGSGAIVSINAEDSLDLEGDIGLAGSSDSPFTSVVALRAGTGNMYIDGAVVAPSVLLYSDSNITVSSRLVVCAATSALCNVCFTSILYVQAAPSSSDYQYYCGIRNNTGSVYAFPASCGSLRWQTTNPMPPLTNYSLVLHSMMGYITVDNNAEIDVAAAAVCSGGFSLLVPISSYNYGCPSGMGIGAGLPGAVPDNSPAGGGGYGGAGGKGG